MEQLSNTSALSYEFHKIEPKKVRYLVTEANKKSWREFEERLERNRRDNQKLEILKKIENTRNSIYVEARKVRIFK